MTPSELRKATGKDLNLLSHHLSCLENCNLVESEKQGRNVFYRPKDGIEEALE
ncbi:MAG: helix-turn-helix transcriptional regulator, partial [Desulfobacterales bacterium]|nr:helix-turn-helix transcriptional regulator [Desulfobacterales bacterium]